MSADLAARVREELALALRDTRVTLPDLAPLERAEAERAYACVRVAELSGALGAGGAEVLQHHPRRGSRPSAWTWANSSAVTATSAGRLFGFTRPSRRRATRRTATR